MFHEEKVEMFWTWIYICCQNLNKAVVGVCLLCVYELGFVLGPCSCLQEDITVF